MAHQLRDVLLAQVEATFAGPHTAKVAVLEAVKGLGAAQAAWKPGPERHSIWQIADHLTRAREWLLGFLQGRRVEGEGWTEPEAGEEAWQAALSGLSSAQARLKAAIEELSDEDLLKTPFPNATLIHFLFSEVVAHDAYHSGQIRYVRALQGA